jgi:hypothetical protein
VPSALWRHLQTVLAGEVDDRDDVVVGCGQSDQRRLLRDGEVERLRGGLPGGVSGLDEPAVIRKRSSARRSVVAVVAITSAPGARNGARRRAGARAPAPKR